MSSISSASNYMSNADILAWMQEKTGDMYGNMTAAMNSADTNGDAEAALNKIRGDIANCKDSGGDTAAIHDEVNATLAQFGDVPGVKDALQPIADKLNSDFGTSDPLNGTPAPLKIAASLAAPPDPSSNPSWAWSWSQSPPVAANVQPAAEIAPKQVTISSDNIDSWTKNIDNTVGDLGKSDQLALINIQEMNSEINQAKQTASALMDAADKSSNDIISHIG